MVKYIGVLEGSLIDSCNVTGKIFDYFTSVALAEKGSCRGEV